MATLYKYENNINLIKYRHFDGPGILVYIYIYIYLLYNTKILWTLFACLLACHLACMFAHHYFNI